MAHLEVKPKSGTPWWVWLLLLIIAVILLLFFLKGCGDKNSAVAGADSSGAAQADTTGKQPLAVTGPDWKSVDFNSPKTQDAGVTDKDIAVSGNDKYTIYTLGENIMFPTDQNTVYGNADSKLKQIADAINKRFPGADIGVFGNTDSTGSTGHNKVLGAQRASAVRSWLIANGGIDSSKISVHSFGENEPIASNADAAGRKQNRNVEIVAFQSAK